MRPVTIAEQIAEAAVRYPAVPIVFAETRSLAQEWTCRFFGAALGHRDNQTAGSNRLDDLVEAGPLPPRQPSTTEVRAWATSAGLDVADRGRLRPEIWHAYHAATATQNER